LYNHNISLAKVKQSQQGEAWLWLKSRTAGIKTEHWPNLDVILRCQLSEKLG